MDRNKRLKDMTLEDEPLRSEGIQQAGNERKVQCCKEKYCIGTWNVRSMNLGKLGVVKHEMARINTDILVSVN